MAFNYKNYQESDEVKKKRQEAEENSSYVESAEVTKARDEMEAHNANRVAAWTGGTYGQALKDAMDRITNREKFSYDLNGDALYQQYKDRYINQGRLAMMDTMGQASALTGGYGNSYASTAGNQAYQGHLQQLNDVIPELYQLAYDKYNRDGEELYNQYSMYNNAYNQEYGEYRNRVADWNAEASRLSDAYYNAYNRDYGQYADAYDRAFARYQQAVSEDQYARDLSLQYAKLNNDSASYEAKIQALQSDNNYKDALLYIGNGIEEINGIEFNSPENMRPDEFALANATKEKNKKEQTQYKFDGKVYATRDAAEKALVQKLDEYDLNDDQLNAIFAKLGM